MKKNKKVFWLLFVFSVFCMQKALCVDLRNVRIVCPSAESSELMRFAREELEKHLELVTGVRPGETGSFVISLGVPPPGESACRDFESVASFEKGRLWLWGDDTQGRHGTLFAVYGFLRFIGVDWVYPGDAGIVFSRLETVHLKEGWRSSYRPPLVQTEVRNYFGPPKIMKGNASAPPQLRLSVEDARKWCEANRVFFLRHRIESREKIKYGHAFVGWDKRFRNTHPEYLAQPDPKSPKRGNADPNGWGKLCVSNPGVVEQIISDWKDAGCPKYLNVCENDARGFCRCSACVALDSPLPNEDFHVHKTDRYLWLWNRIAEKAVKIRSDVKLTAYIYGDYRLPPRRQRVEYPDAMYFGIVPTITDDYRAMYEAWKKAGMKHFFLRPNFLAYWGSLPRGYERLIWKNFQESREYGIVGVDYDGYPGRYPMYIDHYVVCRAITSPDLQFEDIVRDFCSAYGEAAPEVFEYFSRIRERGERHVAKLSQELRDGSKNVLDDSMYGDYRFVGHTEKDLLEDFNVLNRASGRKFSSPAAERRYRDLLVRSRHAVLTCRFYVEATPAWPDETRVNAAAGELMDFRVKHFSGALHDSFGNVYGSSFASGESWAWWKTYAYPVYMVGDGLSAKGPQFGWRSGFEGDRLLGWAARDAFVGIVREPSSEGSCCVKLRTSESPMIGMFRPRVPVVGGACYRLSASVRADDGVEYVSLRAIGSKDPVSGLKSKELGEVRKKCDGRWHRIGMDFTVADHNRDKAMIYVNVGRGGEGKYVWVDDVKLEKVDVHDASTR